MFHSNFLFTVFKINCLKLHNFTRRKLGKICALNEGQNLVRCALFMFSYKSVFPGCRICKISLLYGACWMQSTGGGGGGGAKCVLIFSGAVVK
jgi:hypothetical protein